MREGAMEIVSDSYIVTPESLRNAALGRRKSPMGEEF